MKGKNKNTKNKNQKNNNKLNKKNLLQLKSIKMIKLTKIMNHFKKARIFLDYHQLLKIRIMETVILILYRNFR